MITFKRLGEALGVELSKEDTQELIEKYKSEYKDRTLKLCVLYSFMKQKGIKAKHFNPALLKLDIDAESVIKEFCDFDVNVFLDVLTKFSREITLKDATVKAVVKYLLDKGVIINFNKLSRLLGVSRFRLISIARSMGYSSLQMFAEHDERRKKLNEILAKYVSNPKTREAIVEYVLTDLTQEEVENRYGVSSVTIRYYLRKIGRDLGKKRPLETCIALREMIGV